MERDLWTASDLAEEVGAPYSTVTKWTNKGYIPTYKWADDDHVYMHPDDIGGIIEMARLTREGMEGWGGIGETAERHGVQRNTVTKWLKAGKIQRIHTYGHSIYSMDAVEGISTAEAIHRAKVLAAEWKGFIRVHSRVNLKEGQKLPDVHMPEAHKVATPPETMPERTQDDRKHQSEVAGHPTPQNAPQRHTGPECADSTCTNEGTDDLGGLGIGKFCHKHAPAKRKILGLRTT